MGRNNKEKNATKNAKKSAPTKAVRTPVATENSDGSSSSDMDVEREITVRSVKNVRCAPIETAKRMRVGDIDKKMWILRELEEGEEVEDNDFVISKNSCPCAAADKVEQFALREETCQRAINDAKRLRDIITAKDESIALLKQELLPFRFLRRLSDCLRHLGTVSILPRLQDEYPDDNDLQHVTIWEDCLPLLGKGPMDRRTPYQRDLQESVNNIITELHITVNEWIYLYAINHNRNMQFHEPVTTETLVALEADLRSTNRGFFLYDSQKNAIRTLIKALHKILHDSDNTVINTPTGPPCRISNFRRKR